MVKKSKNFIQMLLNLKLKLFFIEDFKSYRNNNKLYYRS